MLVFLVKQLLTKKEKWTLTIWCSIGIGHLLPGMHLHSQGPIIAHINYFQLETFKWITFNVKLSQQLHSMWTFHINYIECESFTSLTFHVKLSIELYLLSKRTVKGQKTNPKTFIEVDVCGKVWWKYFPRIVLCICFCPRMFFLLLSATAGHLIPTESTLKHLISHLH